MLRARAARHIFPRYAGNPAMYGTAEAPRQHIRAMPIAGDVETALATAAIERDRPFRCLRPSAESIVALVAAYCGVAVKDLVGPRQFQRLARRRHLAAALAYWDANTTFAAVQILTGQDGAPMENGSLYVGGIVPNFVNMDTGDFALNQTMVGAGTGSPCSRVGPGGAPPGVSPACGVGLVPWDYDDVGAVPVP
jgi:hypothetical protein